MFRRYDNLTVARALSSRLPIIGLAATGILLLMLCIPAPAADETVDMLTVADPTGDWGFPSPYAHYSRGPGYIRMSLIFDTLVWKDQTGFVPALSESWEYEAHENAYVFNLRKDVRWNDGEPFSADDVVFTLDYIKEHPYSWVDAEIVDKAQALDDSTVRITLTRPYAPFLDQVAGTLPIIPEHVYKKVSNPEEFRDARALTGTGPFKLLDYDKAQGTYLYQANPDYYLGLPKVQKLRFVKVSEEMAAAALKKGDADAAAVQGESARELERAGFTVLEGSHDWIAKLMINHKKPPLSEVKVRQAIAYSIDRQALVETILRGFGLAGSPGLYASDNPWYNPDQEQYAYDPARAGDLLVDLGYSRQGDCYARDGQPLHLELLVTSSNERAGEMIRQQLDDAGFEISMRSVDSKTLDNLVGEWKFDLALSGHGGLGGDPNILNKVILGQGFNSARYDADTRLSDVLKDQNAEMDPDKRRDLVFLAQQIYASDVPALSIYYTNTYWASNQKVDFYFTHGGVGSGVPIALNKMALV
ncbi:MAG: putative ABC transporter periplasmic-binding protein [Methanosaeta sp. PtaB.Bin039]|nr:MAG: putative ABC transporter periplasmic-binding protein [Methanosaeta sp. PtaB.Bin039]HOT07722.1 ABC transporter substrate-binding protein [Methanotrichaceae archaeon]HQF17422.1 ABC transporter substrate-binding protein [Methanotrichaceae archaeon]HQI92180.1 ABC transporter substrate-binding protein [Methanotrichaceae archaeon]